MTNIEQLRDANTPEEMRAELSRASYYDNLIHAVECTAKYNGLSGEDKYTILAYHAIKELNKYKQAGIEFFTDHPFLGVVPRKEI